MKRIPIFPMLLLATLTLGIAPITRAQSLKGVLDQFFDWHNQASEEQLRSFDSFLQNHPEIARDLRERPDLVNDREFLEHHRALDEWLEHHPEAARAFRDNPREFMERERHFQHYSGDMGRGDERQHELARFDWFLDSHPDIRRALMHRPELANRDEYLEHHPELREFLDRHPGVREELREHPREFMDREARFEDRG